MMLLALVGMLGAAMAQNYTELALNNIHTLQAQWCVQDGIEELVIVFTIVSRYGKPIPGEFEGIGWWNTANVVEAYMNTSLISFIDEFLVLVNSLMCYVISLMNMSNTSLVSCRKMTVSTHTHQCC